VGSDWLALAGKTVLVTGLANRKSVAWHVGKRLEEAGARVIWSVHTEKRRADVLKLLASADVLVCDVEKQADIDALPAAMDQRGTSLDGLVHSIAFASYSGASRVFHETSRQDFLRAVDVSCFSLVAMANALKDRFVPGASVVAISISTTRMAAENYGAMARSPSSTWASTLERSSRPWCAAPWVRRWVGTGVSARPAWAWWRASSSILGGKSTSRAICSRLELPLTRPARS
jgi:enoyl-[acyl-carrier-protein] reductase (NADH)